jgi:hypothetical protein
MLTSAGLTSGVLLVPADRTARPRRTHRFALDTLLHFQPAFTVHTNEHRLPGMSAPPSSSDA